MFPFRTVILNWESGRYMKREEGGMVACVIKKYIWEEFNFLVKAVIEFYLEYFEISNSVKRFMYTVYKRFFKISKQSGAHKRLRNSALCFFSRWWHEFMF